MNKLAGRHPRVSRAERKRLQKKFKVGQEVTWGNGLSYHPIIAIEEDGVYVNGGPGYERHFLAWSQLRTK